jgi:energy-coupling factor transporter ATP-binding protein EcfA2
MFVILSQAISARLDNRPLLGTIDKDLFVVPTIMPELLAAVRRQLNVLILGERGSGKTSLLRALDAAHHDPARPTVYADLGLAQTAEEALLVIADALGHPWGMGEALQSSLAPKASSSSALLRLARRLEKAPPALIMVDSPPGGGESHTLFGRLRDVLWQLPHQWVVAANKSLRDELTRAPAAAFFDVQLQLEPLSLDQQRDFLERRLQDEEPGLDIEAIVGETDGLPRSLLQLARASVLSSVDEALARREDQRDRLAPLPNSASMIVSFIEDHGPTSGSDPVLLSALGVSGQRARQIMRGLEEAGILRSFSEQEERRGRPRKLYELNDEISR